MSFNSVAKQVSKKEGYNIDRAKAIIAAGARNASPAAKRKNPKLKRVPGA